MWPFVVLVSSVSWSRWCIDVRVHGSLSITTHMTELRWRSLAWLVTTVCTTAIVKAH